MKKNTTLELTINPEYVKNWGLWEATRELIQNAADANDIGFPMHIEFKKRPTKSILHISNEGITINRSTLLLGTSTKAGDNRQRGQFGEGFKLAWLVLLRLNRSVWCKSGAERWIPKFEHSNTFDADLLKVDIAPVKYENTVITEIEITEEEWTSIQERILFLSPQKTLSTSSGAVLTDEDTAGYLFSRGLFVGKLPGNYRYGYDLFHVDLDRDRRIAEPWSLKTQIFEVLSQALDAGKVSASTIYDLLNEETEEAEAVTSSLWRTGNLLIDKVITHFQQVHGSDAVPVSSISESLAASCYGMKDITVSSALKKVLESKLGSFESKKTHQEKEITKRYSVNELEPEEKANLSWMLNLLGDRYPHELQVVDFMSKSTLGFVKLQDSICIQLNRLILKDRNQLLSTMIHELAHIAGPDGSVEHLDKVSEIFSEIIIHHLGDNR